jgi:hypothetical protein
MMDGVAWSPARAAASVTSAAVAGVAIVILPLDGSRPERLRRPRTPIGREPRKPDIQGIEIIFCLFRRCPECRDPAHPTAQKYLF